MSKKSEEWDDKEKSLDYTAKMLREFASNPNFRKVLNRALHEYRSHKKPNCKIITLLIVDENKFCTVKELMKDNLQRRFVLRILKCRSCGWDYHKKWWMFWK